jgi:hypothetical protein
MNDGVATAHTELARTQDLPAPGDRGASDVGRREPHLDLVVEPQHVEVLGLDVTARIVRPVLEQTEASAERRFRFLCEAEDGREMDAAARVGIGPRDAPPLAVGNDRDRASLAADRAQRGGRHVARGVGGDQRYRPGSANGDRCRPRERAPAEVDDLPLRAALQPNAKP